jgi:hypothetical protein
MRVHLPENVDEVLGNGETEPPLPEALLSLPSNRGVTINLAHAPPRVPPRLQFARTIVFVGDAGSRSSSVRRPVYGFEQRAHQRTGPASAPDRKSNRSPRRQTKSPAKIFRYGRFATGDWRRSARNGGIKIRRPATNHPGPLRRKLAPLTPPRTFAKSLILLIGGEGGIRTPDTVARMPHFECGAFNHSATSPRARGWVDGRACI